VLALEVRPNLLSGDSSAVRLDALRSVGDVLLVHDARAIEPAWSVRGTLPLVGVDVLTETGEYLGKASLPHRTAGGSKRRLAETLETQVRDFDFDPEDGSLLRVRFDAFGWPLIPVRPAMGSGGVATLVAQTVVTENSFPLRPTSSPCTRCPATSCAAAARSGL
jgi:hypothetical protein